MKSFYTYNMTHKNDFLCHYPSFRLVTKERVWKGVGWECNMIVWESVKEWAHTFPSGLTLWKLESR